ncbi:hypothetical protein SHAM105786_03830 [Shewanella amazonensis]
MGAVRKGRTLSYFKPVCFVFNQVRTGWKQLSINFSTSQLLGLTLSYDDVNQAH